MQKWGGLEYLLEIYFQSLCNGQSELKKTYKIKAKFKFHWHICIYHSFPEQRASAPLLAYLVGYLMQ